MPTVTKEPTGIRELNQNAPDTPGSATLPSIATGDGAKTFARRVAMRFSNIKAGVNQTVTGAVLKFSASAGLNGPADILANRIVATDQDWDPTQATWNSKDFGIAWGTAGGSPDATVQIEYPSTILAARSYALDVTAIAVDVQNQAKGVPYQMDLLLRFEASSGLRVLTVTAATVVLQVTYDAIPPTSRGSAASFIPAATRWRRRDGD